MADLWHTLTPDEVAMELRTDAERGLTSREAVTRLSAVGPNAIAGARPRPAWRLLLSQFGDFMVLVLLAATGVSFALGEVADAVTIVAIVVMNALLGFVQEYRAERSVEALKALTAPTARVRRDGRWQVLPARELVPGDLIELEAGDRVPADARLLTAVQLETEEAALTGESAAVAKRVEALADPHLGPADRANMVFMGTTVSRGRGLAVVVATGMATEMGAIAHLMREATEDRTPLQRRLEHLGHVLVALSLAIVGLVVLTGVWRGEPLYAMFLTGVSLAVAAIPEGLPAIVTVALALGVQRMIRRHAIVRRLPAVETLGSTTVICSDKTGTLTLNRMSVTELWAGGRQWRRREDRFLSDGGPAAGSDVEDLLQAGALCTNARLATGGEPAAGDPTELAILEAAAATGQDPVALGRRFHRRGEIPFEPERRSMAVAVEDRQGSLRAVVKGAPDRILPQCRFLRLEGRVVVFDEGRRAAVRAALEAMAGRALRVLAVAERPLRGLEPAGEWERDLVLLGLVGMMDPPRPDAVDAIRVAARAGIRTVMITGDHPHTARAIAESMGILRRGERVVTGQELDAMSDEELAAAVTGIRVYARVAPPHKLRVVRAWKARGEVVAMTGDGVNDAPAVKEADIGVAMGLTGTDVTKEAAAMILTDDNFATIVRAVEEGRAIYDNIRKFVRYLLSCNIGEVLVMFLAAFLGIPLPLLPIQILFVNLVTDGLPALALGVDPPDPETMARPPRPPGESLFARGLGVRIAVRGLLIGLSTLLVFEWALGPGGASLQGARTMALATLILSQLLHVFDVRAEDRGLLAVGLFSNPWAVVAVLTSTLMLLAVLYVPTLAAAFRVEPLGIRRWAVVLLASAFVQILAVMRELATGRARRPLPVRPV
ncbi:P-type calcium transport ATPase (sporulation) [Candidatus Hydrogenisulfobacillus filiaventi]|uniref:P-type Ca(2+) transporter n=1 Tax=Candidatus Hydrogenisulfobacillus filiaventi TaxID=2707344 RepID=A0A6F8ZFK2_9FIRM|nr:calcium-translocating P-type ATPase, SERCA-type [Bacillota bacterium]CAB1128525.1 P-type calcium transport ATPase (sporulation) [Candidatus Hydrogenisulfobacillus filiaventi]